MSTTLNVPMIAMLLQAMYENKYYKRSMKINIIGKV